MERLASMGQELPLWLLLALAAGGAGLILGTVLARLRRGAFARDLTAALQDPGRARALRDRHGEGFLYRHSALVERVAARQASALIPLLGMDEIWMRRLSARGRRRDLERVLRYAAPRGLFRCFLAALEHRRLASRLGAWLAEAGELLSLRSLALSGVGEPFDGARALEVFRDKLPEIREMTGDPEWPSRYFAVNVLLHDPDPASERAVWEALVDPHPLVRRTAASRLASRDRERLYRQLLALSLDDPAHEVRQAAWERIRRELADLHRLEELSFSEEQALHLLGLLRPGVKPEEALALRYLDSANLELRYSAASFLSRCGALQRLCLEVDLGDPEGLRRNQSLLQKASEVNVTGFLSAVRESQNPATLLVCARVLSGNGGRELIAPLARKVFGLFAGEPQLDELYRATVRCAGGRGTEEALRLLAGELERFRHDGQRSRLLLEELPERGDFLFLDPLLSLLKDPGCPAKDALRATLARMSRPEVLEAVLAIVRAGRQAYPHAVRIEAVKLLGEMHLPYCLEILLENLPTLPAEQAKEFTRVLARYPQQVFRQKVTRLLECADAKVRAALIAALPASGDRELARLVRQGLKDADPDVRIAAVWALVDYQDTRALHQATSLLRDPVERVRREVAGAFAAGGSEDTLAPLREVLLDPNEVSSVKLACLEGLGSSPLPRAVDILVELLGKGRDLKEAVVAALAANADKRRITRMVESLKDAEPSVRDRITEAFVAMRERGEQAVAELLREEISSLKPMLSSILEKTGYVEERIRRLSHRDPAVRREAAEFLSLVGTRAAFRGMVLAARDPDDEVRVRVVKALERLEAPEGRDILKELENDPDGRVRRYTLWALERLHARAL